MDNERFPFQSTGKHPRCDVCRSGYRGGQADYDGRPSFKCTNCGNYWTNGWDGGEYLLPGQTIRTK